ncbi:alpha-2Db adrenergic receptor [Helicoverpa armigera]|uniref:alpha-2Db adrenergic receptor n=1 Tax=Helicoverpa zea TaxID=7113 RepID=UPI001F56DB14|nr:alpha-2Db adrenergic receptor [Helicoverpa zea]XP_049705259.1 alpha-2Db adrenergic receptor [Helicoverpa armigera]XP_049705260.1 alpha-2Db adrenergic receptor [Helicoverpa armigera]XP_049705261.1 alpha-2Db adrenergic receptor [Helicoverpa armigera]
MNFTNPDWRVTTMVPNTTLMARTTMSTHFNTTVGPNSTFLVPTYMSQEEFFALQMTNGSDANTTLSNDTTVNLVLKTWYPSGYSPAHIIIASVVVTVLMIMVVVGNMLVIIAIVTEKALKNIQNWFIASLAVSDFFLGLVIMPFSLANELMGYWIFGFWWCEIHSAMDVLLCTASIMNLCLISLDRYWSITQAVDYLKKRTPARAALMIAAVWLMSALVCIPPLLGWRVSRPPEQFPQCKVSDDIGYVVYSALGSFYIPSCIMVFVYIRIYFAAKARARRGIRKNPRPRPNEQQTSFSNPPKGTRPMPSTHPMPPGHLSNNNGESTISTIETPQVQIPTVTCELASDISTSEAGDTIPPPPDERKDTLKVVTSAQVQKNPLASCPLRSSTLSVNGELQLQQTRGRAPSVAIDADMVSEMEPSSSDSGVVSRCGGVKPLKLRIFKKTDRRQEKSQPSKSELEPALPKPHKPRDPEREKKRLARKKEKRATLILGLIMGSFIACWLPFFFLYILKAACRNCVIPSSAFAIAFWLGYMNSVLNPVIYTIFNKDFRRAFRRILFK